MPTFLTGLYARAAAVAAVCLLGFVSGCEVRGWKDAAGQVAATNAALADLKHKVAVAQASGAAGQALADQATVAFARSQQKIRTVTKTLHDEIPNFIMPNPVQQPVEMKDGEAAPAVVFGLNNGFVLWHDGRVLGVSPASLPTAAGVDIDAASRIGLSELADLLDDNYGVCEANRDRAEKDEAYILQLKLWYSDLARGLSQ